MFCRVYRFWREPQLSFHVSHHTMRGTSQELDTPQLYESRVPLNIGYEYIRAGLHRFPYNGLPPLPDSSISP